MAGMTERATAVAAEKLVQRTEFGLQSGDDFDSNAKTDGESEITQRQVFKGFGIECISISHYMRTFPINRLHQSSAVQLNRHSIEI